MATANQPRGILPRRLADNVLAYPHPAQASRRAFIAGELLALLLAVALAIIVIGHPGPLPGDVRVEVTWQSWILPHKMLSAALEGLSTIDWPIPSAIGVVVIELILLVLRRWWDAIVSLAAAAFGDGSSYVINQLVQRHRPQGHGIVIVRKITDYYSFPSGHVVHALAFAGIVLFLTYRVRHTDWWLWVIRVALLIFIVMMGPSRVLEGEHWPSDVLEGLLVGAFWLIAGIHLYGWGAQRWPNLLGRSEPSPVLPDSRATQALR